MPKPTTNPPRVGDRSPWGTIDHVQTLAPGIVGVGTPRHGGIWLSPDRRAQIPAAVLAGTWNNGQGRQGWFEEDCDATIPIAAFHEEIDFLRPSAVAFCKWYAADNYDFAPSGATVEELRRESESLNRKAGAA